MGQIYLLTFADGKKYVGKTRTTSNERFVLHRRDAGTARALVYQAWRKFGEPTIRVLLRDVPREELATAERDAITREGSLYPLGYNSSRAVDETKPSRISPEGLTGPQMHAMGLCFRMKYVVPPSTPKPPSAQFKLGEVVD